MKLLTEGGEFLFKKKMLTQINFFSVRKKCIFSKKKKKLTRNAFIHLERASPGTSSSIKLPVKLTYFDPQIQRSHKVPQKADGSVNYFIYLGLLSEFSCLLFLIFGGFMVTTFDAFL